MGTGITRISAPRSLALLIQVGGPLFAKGIIVRRPTIVALLQRTGIERLGVRALQRLRVDHGDRPAMLRLGSRREAALLAPADIRRLLVETPSPFSPDSSEKHGATLPKGTGFVVHLPFLHRDDERLPFADRFAPEIWLDGTAERATLVPFSTGPGECPARNLVLMIASDVMATIVRGRGIGLPPHRRLDPDRLPPTLDQFSLPLELTALPETRGEADDVG